jgi:D-3-phosphoglycerate dehydrogenase / 2-oxoglutarate reductase
MRILFADLVDESRVEALSAAGNECRLEPGLTEADLPDHIGDAEALVVRSTRVSGAAIDAAPELSLIVRAGAGVDNIDVAAASARGIYVCNVPGKNAVAVAELTMGLLLSIDRRIADGTADLRAGHWNKKLYSAANGIHGRRMAIIGLGDIGLVVAERAKAFGMDVVAVRKPSRDPATTSRIRSVGVRLVDTEEELLSSTDVVSVHVSSSPSTVGLIGAAFLAQLPDRAIVLNTARGNVIDETALIAAMDERGIRAGLDVWPGEPGAGSAEWSSALSAHPNVVGTHHIGASTNQAQEAVADGMVDVIDAYQAASLLNCVNLVDRPLGSSVITVRHLDRVGVLAKILICLRGSGHNVQQMHNEVFAGGTAAVATINVVGVVTDDLRSSILEIDEVLAVSVTKTAQEATS